MTAVKNMIAITNTLTTVRQKINIFLTENSCPLFIFFVTRVGLFLLVYLSLNFIALDPNSSGEISYNHIIGGWIGWDGGWYRNIVDNGYWYDVTAVDAQFNVVFFPLYPLTIRLVNLIIPKTHWSGLIVSNLSFLIGLIALYQIVLRRFNQTIARHTVLLLATFPFSFYFSTIYSESLFFCTTIVAFFLAQEKKWFWAAFFAALASATRSIGIVVGFGVLLIYIEQNKDKLYKPTKQLLWILFISPIGLLSYAGFLWLRFGNPLLFMTGRDVTGWEKGRGLHELWPTIHALLSRYAILHGSVALLNVLHITVFVVALCLLLWFFKQLPWVYAVWSITVLIISFAAGWHGIARYILPIFPFFIAMALFLKKEKYILGWSYIQTLLLAMFTIMFSHHYWVS